jgi:hypothetical protein
MQIMFYLAAVVVFVHGLIHLMGFVAYWPLAEIAELPYKATLLGTRWSLNESGMRFFSVLWLGTAVTLAVASMGMLVKQSWWYPVMWAGVVLSLIITVLDWQNAFRGAIISLVLLVLLLLVTGLRVQPQPFPAYSEQTPTFNTVPLPANLPAPVARYYQTILGDEVPVVETAVINTRGTVRFAGITFPARLIFTHEAGQGYRHYIEATVFGFPLMKVNERYLDGKAKMELPVGVVENESKIDMAANLGLWGESIWLPSIFLTDSRVRWEAIDETSARLIVPFADGEDSFTVTFDPQTSLIQSVQTLRYRDAADTEKIPWLLEPIAWKTYHGMLVPTTATATWQDEGTPWLVIEIEDIAYNVDVKEYIRAKGP